MTFQLTDKLPNVDIGAIKQHVANGITGNSLAIVASQQIAPCGITIGIGDGINNSIQCSSGVSILLAAGNIAYIVKGLVLLLSNCLTGITINKLLK